MAVLDPEKLLVSKIIQEGSLAEVGDIQARFFTNDKWREAFTYITSYYRDHGEVPSLRVMINDCPKVRLVDTDEPWGDLIHRLQKQHVRGIINQYLSDVVADMEEIDVNGDPQIPDIDMAVNRLGALVGKIHNDVPKGRDVDVTQNGSERLARYRERKNNPGMMVGIPSGFETIDRATQGFQPGQLITLTGLTKASKSVFALLMAKAAQEAGKRVLYITFEMTCEEQEQRLDSYRAGFNDMKLLSGNITEEEWSRLEAAVAETENLPPLVFSEDCMTVTAIGAKIDLLKPDIVVVDGVYMMEDEIGESKGSPQALANIVSSLKFMAMNREICIIDVTQSTPARTKGEVLNHDSIMGSRAFTQYSNVVIGVERTEDVNMRKLRIIMTRRGTPTECLVMMDFNTGTFMELEAMDDDLDTELVDDGDEEYNTGF
jgi:archaellum biogenesis ATPase FlaH